MRQFYTLIMVFFTAFTPAKAQYLEVGTLVGGTSYMGDLQHGASDLGGFGPTGGIILRMNYTPHLAVKGTAIYGSFDATDRHKLGDSRARNLEVQTTYYELAATAELNLTKFDIIDGHITAPYVFVGLAGMYFMPKARYEGKYISLRPLGTEGQTLNGGKAYSPFTVAIPFGLGVKMSLNRRMNIGFECGFRYTFTDYLDDISGVYPNIDELVKQNPVAAEMSYRTPQYYGKKLENPVGQLRGDKAKYDIYYFIGGSLTINLGSRQTMEFNRSYRSFFKS